MKKKIILSFGLTLAIISSMYTNVWAVAEQFILNKFNVQIIVDGKEKTTKLPILNYQGTTYVPLKELGGLLQRDVNWDDKNKAINISNYFRIVTPDNYNGVNTELCDLINKHVHAINKGDEKAYWNLFTEDGKRSFPTFPQFQVILADNMEFIQDSKDVYHAIVHLGVIEDNKLLSSESTYYFQKVNDTWKITAFSR